MNKKNKLIIIFFLFNIFFIFNFAISAQKDAKDIIKEKIEFPTVTSDLENYIEKFFNFSLTISGILAIFGVLIGAIYYSISGAIDKKKEAISIIGSSIFGLVLIFSIVLILNLINPRLTDVKSIIENIKITIPTTSTTSNSTSSIEKYKLENNGFTKTQIEKMKELITNLYNIKKENKIHIYDGGGDCSTILNYRYTSNVDGTLFAIYEGFLPPICKNGCKGKNVCEPKEGITLTAPTLYGLHFMASSTKNTSSVFSIGFTITSLTSGDHNPNSLHYKGRAADITPWCKDKSKREKFNLTTEADCWKEFAQTIAGLSETSKVLCEATFSFNYRCNNSLKVTKATTTAYFEPRECKSIFEPSTEKLKSKIKTPICQVEFIEIDTTSIQSTNKHIHIEFKDGYNF